MAILVRPKMAGRSLAPAAGTGPLSLGLIIAIVLVGAIILASGVALLSLYLSRRRAAHHNQFADDISGEDTDTGPTVPRRTPRRLQKRDNMTEKSRGMSPASSVPVTPMADSPEPVSAVCDRQPPTIPPIFSKRISFNPFRSSWSKATQAQAQTHKRKPSWIDEDALHGPKVTKPDDPKRRSLRDSWPLKNMVPTLPKLGAISSLQSTPRREQERPMVPGVGEIAAGHGQIHQIAIGDLPRPPKSALIVHKRQPARNAINHGGNLYLTSDPNRLNSSLNVSPPRQGGRMTSTDSTLSEILKSTEQRLQEGSSTGVAKRNRAAGKTGTPRKNGAQTEASTPKRTPTRYHPNSQSGTPSAVKSHPTTPSYDSQPSPASLLSAPECVYEDPRPTPMPMVYSSPTRKAPMRSRSYSLSSSTSSSLSTVYSMDETPEGNTMVSTPPNNSVRLVNKLPKARVDTSADDPFVITSPSTPPRPGSSGKERGHQSGSETSNNAQALKKPQRFSKPPTGQLPVPAYRNNYGLSASGSPLDSPVLGEFSQPRSSHPSVQPSDFYCPTPPQGECLESFDYLASAVRASLDKHTFDSPQECLSNPRLTITSPSDASSVRTPASGISNMTMMQRRAQLQSSPTPVRKVSPQNQLRVMKNAPALGRDMCENGEIPDVPPLPDFVKIHSGDGDDPLSLTPKSQQRWTSRPRVTSTSSSVYSQDFRDDLAKLAADTNNASFQLNANVTPSSRFHPDPVKKDSARPLEPSLSTRLGVGATISELRRMNSAVSTMSGVSNVAGDEGSPTLPVLRGGGFSPSHRKCGSKNYLSVGTPLKKDSSVESPESGSPPGRKQGSPGRNRISRQRAPGAPSLLSLGSTDMAETSEETTENEPIMPLKMPRLVLPSDSDDRKGMGLREGNGGNTATPPKHLKLLWDDDGGIRKDLSKRVSTESLGLYDKDGFLISSPARVPSPGKDSESLKPSSGLRL